ncbi:serine hydrolase, partial [candidate division GN15 bacterium]|nr:serine hydrolase [candidate division GN15 bacterium]
MRKPLFALVLIITFVSAPHAQPTSNYSHVITEIERFVTEQIEDSAFVGVSVAFQTNDFYWADGFGWADIENRVPATAESVYRLASVTKPMTAVGIVRLVAEGKVELDAEVQEYVPDFPTKQWPVTVRHLLGHLAGVSHYKNYTEEAWISRPVSTREALAIFEDWDLLFKPGEQFSYTTYGYNLLGAVIEGATGQSFGDYMTEQLWQPLGMNRTRIDVPIDIIPNRVEGYQRVDGELKNSWFVDLSMKYAGGGTVSTVGDMIRFARGVAHARLFGKNWVDSMWTAMVTTDQRYTRYGMGWSVRPFGGMFTVS